MKRNRPSGFQQRKIKKAKELAVEALSGSILRYVASSNSSCNTTQTQRTVESDLDKTDNAESLCQDTLFEGKSEKESDIQVERQSGEDKREYDQEKGRNNENEERKKSEESERVDLVDHTEKELHDYNRFDVASWPMLIPDDLRVEIVQTGSELYQNRDGPFLDTVVRPGGNVKGQSRHFNPEWFYKALPNGEKILRKWMVYSPTKNSLYCFCCKLFTRSEKNHHSFANGFNSWWKLNPKVPEHENSENLF